MEEQLWQQELDKHKGSANWLSKTVEARKADVASKMEEKKRKDEEEFYLREKEERENAERIKRAVQARNDIFLFA